MVPCFNVKIILDNDTLILYYLVVVTYDERNLNQ
jgi:hypothetical protein